MGEMKKALKEMLDDFDWDRFFTVFSAFIGIMFTICGIVLFFQWEIALAIPAIIIAGVCYAFAMGISPY